MPKREYNKPQPIYRSRRERQKKKKTSWLPAVLLFFAFVTAAVAGALFASSSLFDEKPVEKKTELMMATGDKTVIMLMGVDEREGDVGRSDTLMIATLDPKKKKAAILSIPRDTRVKIPGHGFDKINAAYAYGGHKLTKSTVENLLGVEMEHYVLINVNAFTKIIDAIGGVDINVEKRMYYEDPWDDNGGLVINLYPGQQHMDGKTAITYVRYRDEEGDIGRIARQQKFMQAVMDRLTSPTIIPKIPAIISEVVDCIDTDLSVKQMIELMAAMKDAQSRGLQTEMLPGRPMYIGGISYWLPDLSKLRTTIANTLDVQMTSNLRSAMEREMMEYESSVPDDAQEIPMNEKTKKQLGLDDESDTENNADGKKGLKSSKTSDKNSEKQKDAYMSDPYEEDGDPRRGRTNNSTEQKADSVPAVLPEQTATVPAPSPSPSVPAAGKTAN
ncbi:LCP family protein [Anaerovibrio sp.]|uniref:LCP family protein n=1 Tax=Anaerovibrio sp. TaxID=1872532 RepID=UPI003F1612F6